MIKKPVIDIKIIAKIIISKTLFKDFTNLKKLLTALILDKKSNKNIKNKFLI
jgi:hypothetical protein